jgi:hypothetical protein
MSDLAVDFVGTWVAAAPVGEVRVVLAADGSGNFNGVAGTWRLDAGVMTIGNDTRMHSFDRMHVHETRGRFADAADLYATVGRSDDGIAMMAAISEGRLRLQLGDPRRTVTVLAPTIGDERPLG